MTFIGSGDASPSPRDIVAGASSRKGTWTSLQAEARTMVNQVLQDIYDECRTKQQAARFLAS